MTTYMVRYIVAIIVLKKPSLLNQLKIKKEILILCSSHFVFVFVLGLCVVYVYMCALYAGVCVCSVQLCLPMLVHVEARGGHLVFCLITFLFS